MSANLSGWPLLATVGFAATLFALTHLEWKAALPALEASEAGPLGPESKVTGEV